MTTLWHFVEQFLLLAYQMGPYLLLGFLVAGLLHVFIPERWVYRQLGRSSAWSVTKGAFLGAPLPLCSCGVLPVAASLKKSGASPPAVLSFLIATPVTGVDSILATYALLGTYLAVVRPIASVAVALVSGLLLLYALRFGPRRQEAAPPAGDGNGTSGEGLSRRLRGAVVYAFNDLLAGIAGPVLLGLAIGAAIAVFLPADFFQRFIGSTWLTYAAMVLVATPLYVCATGSIPIAAALMVKGLSPGAALAFLLAGPATNTVAIAVSKDLVGKRGVAIYLGTIVLGSIGLAAAVDWYAAWQGLAGEGRMAHHAHDTAPGWFSIASGIVLLLLSAYHVLYPRLKRLWQPAAKLAAGETQVTLSVPSASCRKCAATITGALGELAPVSGVDVDLERKLVQVRMRDNVSVEQLRTRLGQAGYEAEEYRE